MDEKISSIAACEPRKEEKAIPVKRNGTGKVFGQFKELADSKLKDVSCRAAVFTHPNPDPDALGSQLSTSWLLNRVYGVEVDLFIAGQISHPQNLTMEKLLSPKLCPIESCVPSLYDMTVLVDTIPATLEKFKPKDLSFEAVIDHHVEVPNGTGNPYLYVNIKTGSCCGTIYGLMQYYDVGFEEENDHDQVVATAMMVGIFTDTCNLLSDSSSVIDREAYNSLFDFRDPEALKEIVKFKIPREWVLMKAVAAREAITQDGVAVIGLGMVSPKHRDALAEIAQEMMSWESINLSVAFALIDGCTVQASIRSNCASVSAAKLARVLGEERGGMGGGHAHAAGYSYPLAGFSLGTDDDEETKAEAWKLLNKRESQRIMKLLKK